MADWDDWSGQIIEPRSTTLKWKKYVACYCSAYRWPHTVGMGACDCSIERTYTNTSTPPYTARILREQGSDLCECCGLPSDTHEEDVGNGAYEFWGSRGVDINWQTFTNCCEGSLVPNELESRKPEWFK